MKEMTMKDLTPEIMKALEGLKTKEEMKDYCQKEGYDLTDELADRIVTQFERSGELSDEEVNKVAGGGDWETDEDGRHILPRFHYTC